jgi:uncharacterized cofD-like protein
MLRGLKRHTGNLCAIVSVADDGGGSGVLRDELDMPPPGDIRSCLEALANTEPTMQALLSYRFSDGRLTGQCFGNLFLAALNGMCGSFDEAVTRMSEVLAVTGRVLPVSNDRVTLVAEFEDGSAVSGESKISEYKLRSGSNISRMSLSPRNSGALAASVSAIERADMIIVGPGSLYTSLIPNFLTSGISEAVAISSALKIYVLNVTTQPGETEGYTAGDHINALFGHAGGKLFDYCLVNSLPEGIAEALAEIGVEAVPADPEEARKFGVTLISAEMSEKTGFITRHDPVKLAAQLMRIFEENAETRIYG